MNSPPAHQRLPDNCGIVVLAGGASSRMGVSKSELLIDDENTFLQAIVRTAVGLTDKIVIAVQADVTQRFGHRYAQDPNFQNVRWAEDATPNQGPMEGIHQGLKMLEQDFPGCEIAFVTSCDVPEVNGTLIGTLLQRLGDRDAVTPVDGERIYGMTAIYRTQVWRQAQQHVDIGQLRVSTLASSVDAVAVAVDRLKSCDPNLSAFENINRPADYFDWISRRKIDCTEKMKQQFAVCRPADGLPRLS